MLTAHAQEALSFAAFVSPPFRLAGAARTLCTARTPLSRAVRDRIIPDGCKGSIWERLAKQQEHPPTKAQARQPVSGEAAALVDIVEGPKDCTAWQRGQPHS